MFNYDEMEEMYEILVMQDENGEDESFFVIDSVEKDDTAYFLVVEAIENFDYDNEVETFIMKGVSEQGNDYFLEMVDDGNEYEVVMKLFSENEDIE